MKRSPELAFALVDFAVYEGWEDHLEIWKNALEIDNSKWKRYNGSKREFPTDSELDTLHGIIIPGSRYSANDNWNDAYAFIQKVVERGSPQLFCGCFGSQLLAVALGGTVGANPSKQFCFKSENLEIKSDWYKHPVLCNFWEDGNFGINKSIRLLETHGECVTGLPKNAILAASSDTCVNEIWYIGKNVLAMQSHPEFTVKLMKERILPKLIEKKLLSENEISLAESSFCQSLDSRLVCGAIKEFLCYK